MMHPIPSHLATPTPPVEIRAMVQHSQLSNLPDELVGAIVQRLCLGCTPREEDPSCSCEDTNPRDRSRVAALAALCRTSRQLNNLATVHLYHHPLCTRRAAVLAQTLVARKDLARHLRHLCLGDTFRDALSGRGQAEARLVDAWKLLNPHGQLADDANVQVDVVTSLCPNLESLHTTLDYREALQYMRETGGARPRDETPTQTGGWLQWLGDWPGYISYGWNKATGRTTTACRYPHHEAFFRLCAPHSMPCLRSVVLSHAYPYLPTREDCIGIATLPQLGVDWTTTLPLLRAAPNLTTLTLTLISACSGLSGLGGGGDKTLPNLTTLAFQFSTLSAACLITALRACPNLETFKYHMGGPLVGAEQFTLPEAEHALLAHAPKLKFVRLHPNWGPQRPMFEDEWGFAGRDQLERALARRGVRFEWRS